MVKIEESKTHEIFEESGGGGVTIESRRTEYTDNEHRVYSSLPQTFKEHMEDKYEDVVEFLREDEGKFFTAKDIAEEVGLSKSNTQVEVRKVITELIENHGCPIVSNNKGFSWATHPNMLSKYLDGLEARRDGLQRRIDSIKEIRREWLEQKEAEE